jgi:type VII secretion protein essC
MIISLYLLDKIVEYKVPKEVQGSYSFPADEEDVNIINFEARNGMWVLYKTTDVSIMYDNTFFDSIELKPNNFYILIYEQKNYLIYVTSTEGTKVDWYTYSKNLNMIIGNVEAANMKYLCPYLGNGLIKISLENNQIMIFFLQPIPVYVNKIRVNSNRYVLKFGDEIEIYGFKMLFLKSYLFVKEPNNSIQINEKNAGIKGFIPNYDMSQENIEIRDTDLYNNDDFFMKAPRIRRFYEPKTIKLSTPPRSDEDDQLPLALVIGPMLTMGIISAMTMVTAISNVVTKKAELIDVWPQILMGGIMLVSTLVWPLITQHYNKKIKEKNKKEAIQKYIIYLNDKKKEFVDCINEQTVITQENLITVNRCLDIIVKKDNNLWNRRIDQNDFLLVRVGKGNELLKCKVEYPDEDFTIEENGLRKEVDKIIEEYKYVKNIPIGYSFHDNITTAVMGDEYKILNFMNNIIIQLLTFYSYEDLKIVVMTDEINAPKWDYLKYLNHSFSNDKSFRFFSSNEDSARELSNYLSFEISNRIENSSESQEYNKGPHYFIIVDGYDTVKEFEIIKQLTELDKYYGFNLVILENRLGNLPSKCLNFITLGDEKCVILKNTYEKQDKIEFTPEIVYNIDMMSIVKILSNIPIKFEDELSELPNAISFLEMEHVGKIEQLNILNRWNTNDPTVSLKSEIGVDQQGKIMYLDLHEKAHGPHGLIAGMTGSGKSEFIITYILSLAINYSPDEVSFILIDYKGGGLAFAFENKTLGIELPHLAGTITNLDKSEMNRTLVSINSEIKRRQKIFNDARDSLSESTIDIYKYQKFYREGKVTEPIPHLFIICDEFAELKSQQPDFMDNLISVARIGRSLGVHLILATQKPSGVVNDQIWSNTKFRVCLKVQDESDSKEMLKRPEAASLKQVGRFYLQVGYNEYFALGQSAWCGAKYYPSDKPVKKINKSIDFIDETGAVIKSMQASTNSKIEAQGEQLGQILRLIVATAQIANQKAKKLWLENIKEVIVESDLAQKYSFKPIPYNVEAIIGEYDAPEKQEQGLVKYNLLQDGNTLIYGNNGAEREMFLDTLIYSTTKYHSVAEINYYIVDYGSESLKKYVNLPHVGGVVCIGEEEKFSNLLKMIKEEIRIRKKVFLNYGGDYTNYIKSSPNKLPIKVYIFNNYDSIYESNESLYEELPNLLRDSERYGIIFVITANAINSVQSKISQNLNNIYSYKLKDLSDYITVLGTKVKNMPPDIVGRGIIKQEDVAHEFQTASIIDNREMTNNYLLDYINEKKTSEPNRAQQIPILPEHIGLNNIYRTDIKFNNIPIGISKNNLEITNYDFINNLGTIITANKIGNTKNFIKSLIMLINKIDTTGLIILDATSTLEISNTEFPNYYNEHLEEVIQKIIELINRYKEKEQSEEKIVLIYGINKLINKISSSEVINNLVKAIKEYEKVGLIIVDDSSKLKKYAFEQWFSIFSINDGIWVGKGMADQNLFHLTVINKEMTKNYNNDMGYVISESTATLTKYIDFVSNNEKGDNNEE